MQSNLVNEPDHGQHLIDSIASLRSVEQRLFTTLQSSLANGGSEAEQNKLVEDINKTTSARSKLYSQLLSYYSDSNNMADESRSALVKQKAVLASFENQLANAKNNYNAMREQSNNKLRMVEINTYYGKKYKSYSELIKIILYTCLPILLFVVMKRFGVLPEWAHGTLIGITIFIGGIALVKKIYDISMRSNMDFDQFNWKFNPESVKEFNGNVDLSGRLSVPGMGCIGQSCCSEGTVYDSELNKCVAGNADNGVAATAADVDSTAATDGSESTGTLTISSNIEMPQN